MRERCGECDATRCGRDQLNRSLHSGATRSDAAVQCSAAAAACLVVHSPAMTVLSAMLCCGSLCCAAVSRLRRNGQRSGRCDRSRRSLGPLSPAASCKRNPAPSIHQHMHVLSARPCLLVCVGEVRRVRADLLRAAGASRFAQTKKRMHFCRQSSKRRTSRNQCTTIMSMEQIMVCACE